MKVIDFDAKFMEYTRNWMANAGAKYKTPDEMEDALPDVYVRFLNEPAEWLSGSTPGAYFMQFDDAKALVDLMVEYDRMKIDAPDPLYNRIAELAEASAPHLIALAMDAKQKTALRVASVNLLSDIGTKSAIPLCVDLIKNRAEEGEDELADAAAELLENVGEGAVSDILALMGSASDAAKETFLDVLCNFPGDERIYEETVRQFLNQPERRALYASYLAKLGDSRAIEPLTKILAMTDLRYLDFIEIRDAIESLGGEVSLDRDFSGDPDYETLKGMDNRPE